MRKNVNTERIEGYLYESKLTIKTVQNQTSANYGKEFISGEIEVATDEEGLNVIPVHYTYVTETTANGQPNRNYVALKNIIDSGKTWVKNGKDEALKVRCDTSLALNDFYAQDGSLVSQKINEGGFITIITNLHDENERNTFTADMVITNVSRVEADPEKNIDADYVSIRGAVFNFRQALLPVEFIIRHPAGMSYFENLDVSPSSPVYTKVWGKINCSTVKSSVVQESAFGESQVSTRERKVREWIVTGTAKEPYEFGESDVLTGADLQKAMQDREVLLADVKKRADDYRASKASGSNDFAAAAPSGVTPQKNTSTFNF